MAIEDQGDDTGDPASGATLRRLEAAMRRSLAQHPSEPHRFGALAIVLQRQGRWYEALALLDVAADIAPHDPDIGLARAELLLRLGRLPEGWLLYENRFRTRTGRRDATKGLQGRTAWDGRPLAGRRIFLVQEQGLGDTIQFARYAPLIAARGGKVVLGVERSLRDLLAPLPGVVQVVCSGEPMPEVDVYCHLMSVPRLFGTTLDTIPAAVPYLQAKRPASAPLRSILAPHGAGLRVGLAWAGNPGHQADGERSIPFPLLRPLWAVAGVTWFSLQAGERAADAMMEDPASIRDLSPYLTDFTATASVMAELDLIVSVDTSVAHLAGALGRPTWVLLPFPADWRWFRHGQSTPWYSTARLFRQQQDQTWAGVLECVAVELAGLVSETRQRQQ